MVLAWRILGNLVGLDFTSTLGACLSQTEPLPKPSLLGR